MWKQDGVQLGKGYMSSHSVHDATLGAAKKQIKKPIIRVMETLTYIGVIRQSHKRLWNMKQRVSVRKKHKALQGFKERRRHIS